MSSADIYISRHVKSYLGTMFALYMGAKLYHMHFFISPLVYQTLKALIMTVADILFYFFFFFIIIFKEVSR